MPIWCVSLALAVAHVPEASAVVPADAWPAFRGDGSGRTSARGLPVAWSPGRGVAWKADLPGYGQSSPVVWKGRVYVTAVEGENKEKNLVLAFDARSGRRLWARELPASQPGKMTGTVSRAAPTPAADAGGLYALFESGDLFGLGHDGAVRWSRSLVKDHGKIEGNHGVGSSLAQAGDAVFVLMDHQGPSYLLAVEKSTGRERWKAERPSRVGWTSPVVARREGRDEVVVSSGGRVQGYDAETGRVQWTLEGVTGNATPSATVAGDRVLVGASESRRSPDPGKAAESNCCLRLTDGGGYEVLWRADKATSSFASPLAHRGCAYFVNPVGVVYCLDLETGKVHYAERTAGACWASPVGAGEHVYLFGKDGVTTVLKAGPRFEKVATNRLWAEKPPPADAGTGKPGAGGPGAAYLDPIVYGAAVVDEAIYLRTGTALYCLGGGR